MAAFVEGKVAIATGAGGGIGRDFALAREGASVAVKDIPVGERRGPGPQPGAGRW